MIISNIYLNGKAVSSKELSVLTVKNQAVSSILKKASQRESPKSKNSDPDYYNNNT